MMRETERLGCSNLGCDYVGFSAGECPECGCELTPPKGDEYQFSGDNEDALNDAPAMSDFDDDPESGPWYSDGGESYSTM